MMWFWPCVLVKAVVVLYQLMIGDACFTLMQSALTRTALACLSVHAYQQAVHMPFGFQARSPNMKAVRYLKEGMKPVGTTNSVSICSPDFQWACAADAPLGMSHQCRA